MHNSQKQAIVLLAEKLKNAGSKKVNALIGFDGFVDEIVHVVDKRIDIENFIRLDSMAEYGRRIEKSAGLSTNVEMVTENQKLGGNGPIFANALIEYGFDLTYIGALGLPDIHPVFGGMVSRCKAISLANPARTDAIEFLDGKIISSKLESFKDINWQNLKEKVGVEQLVEMLNTCDLVGFENWTMVNYMSEIWEYMLSEVLPKLKVSAAKPTIFFDLADPEKRKKEDILEALKLIGRFREYYQTVIGLNKKEASEISEILGMPPKNQDMESQARYIYTNIDVDALVIHPVKEACVVTQNEFFYVEGPYCEHPKLTTGAGDNFNAGFVFGKTTGFGMQDALFMGTATSGFYVRNKKSPDLQQIIEFLYSWSAGRLDQ